MLARDVEIIETPTSLTPEGVEVEAVAPEANGDTKLYVVRATDKEIQNILFGLSASDNNKLFPLLRPGNGDTDTKLTPMAGPTIGALTEGASTGDQVGPDQAVR